jgi:tripartite-type tricarboxylate transporter receptor subunit TctC
MQELFALLKANPGKYSYASPGYGSSPHLACEWLFKLTYGLDVVHVPFQGIQAVTATLAGQTPILHITVPLERIPVMFERSRRDERSFCILWR